MQAVHITIVQSGKNHVEGVQGIAKTIGGQHRQKNIGKPIGQPCESFPEGIGDIHTEYHGTDAQCRPKALTLQEIEHIVIEAFRGHRIIIAGTENHDNAKKHQRQHDEHDREIISQRLDILPLRGFLFRSARIFTHFHTSFREFYFK